MPFWLSRCINFGIVFAAITALALGADSAVAQTALKAEAIDRLKVLNDRDRTVNRRRPEVLILREALAAAGMPTVPTGDKDRYDADLVARVRDFQKQQGLRSTGLPGPATRRRLRRILAGFEEGGASAGATERLTLADIDRLEVLNDPKGTVNRRRPEVLILRKALAAAGIKTAPTGREDRYDADLVAGVRIFQERQGLNSTGLPGPATRERLGRALVTSAPVPPGSGLQPPPKRLPPAPETTPLPPRRGVPPVSALKPPPIPMPPPAQRPVRPQPADHAEPMFSLQAAGHLRQAIRRYERHAAAGGFGSVPRLKGKKAYRVGTKHRNIRRVIARLRREGFLPSGYPSSRTYDRTVSAAVMRFQASRGITATGRIGRLTRRAMNTPAKKILKSLRNNLSRMLRLEATLRKKQLAIGDRFVVINAAAGTLQLNEGAKLVHWENIVVGRPNRKTPEFVGRLTFAQLNPTWTPTRRMVRHEWAPREARKPGTLVRNNMRPQRGGAPVKPATINWRKPPPWLTIVQKPGPHNALGAIRFSHDNMKRNEYYLHGTPNVEVFRRGMAARLLSAGCVRLADPVVLADLLLRDSPGGWDAQRLRAAIAAHDGGWKAGPRIEIATKVPVIWTYLTAWATADGRAHFRNDVYGRDSD